MFKYPTVYDPRSKALTQLRKVPEGMDLPMKVVGSHMVEKELEVYKLGLLNPYSDKIRERYALNLDRVRMDFKNNTLSIDSFQEI
jgi:hypothetical protein